MTRLADRTVLARVMGAQARCNQALGALRVHLREVDARSPWAREGLPSMHACCVEGPRMSEGAADKRVTAARLGRRLPAVMEAVRDGRLHLSAVLLLAPRLTGENHRALMAEASGKSKREVEKVVARWFPQRDAAISVRRLPAERPEPLSEGRYKVSAAASQALVDKLEEAKGLISHRVGARGRRAP